MTENQKVFVKKGKIHWKDLVFVWLMLAWALIHFAVFWVYCNLNSFRLTLFRFNTQTATYEWYGLTRFINVAKGMFGDSDVYLKNGLINSLISFPVQVFIILPLAFFMAYFLYKKLPGAGAFRVVFFLPSILSTVVLAMVFRYQFNSDFGSIDHLIRNLTGRETPDWFSSMSPTAMPLTFLFGVWAGLGYYVVLLNGAIQRLPSEIFEAGKIDGVTVWREMFQFVLPLIMPTYSMLFLTGSLAPFSYYLQPMLLCGPSGGVDGKTGTIALRVMSLMQNGATEDAAAIGLFMSLIGIPFVLLIKWITEKLTPDVTF